ncbi:thiosulfate sulfurtransferase/rhodanese-like domain-containing protein 3 [Clavelina lepadiformis]|uniref:thiosulfate sulfurtransferase/rhodanese-like domain-containing protein 3 n=1 Tax=Clavelina lepadiformis TaxID=159417 RepID=UPI004042F531
MHQLDPPKLRPDQQESIENLKIRIANDDVIVIDVRNPDEVARSGKIDAKRWINIPFPEVESALAKTPEDFKAKYTVGKPSNNGQEIVFHCGRVEGEQRQ